MLVTSPAHPVNVVQVCQLDVDCGVSMRSLVRRGNLRGLSLAMRKWWCSTGCHRTTALAMMIIQGMEHGAGGLLMTFGGRCDQSTTLVGHDQSTRVVRSSSSSGITTADTNREFGFGCSKQLYVWVTEKAPVVGVQCVCSVRTALCMRYHVYVQGMWR